MNIKDPMELIDSYAAGDISLHELTMSIPLPVYNKYSRLIQDAGVYNKLNCKKTRNMKVIYLCGKSGSGKTTLAKYLAEKFGYERSYFITSEGDHPFDNYKEQKCVIMDDYRGSVRKFSSLLKILDPNTPSECDARYKNVNLAFCEMIIITTIFKPNKLYENKCEGEEYRQLIRRLDGECYLQIDSDNMIRQYDANNDMPTGKILGDITVLCPVVNNNHKRQCCYDSLLQNDALTEEDINQLNKVPELDSNKIQSHIYKLTYDRNYRRLFLNWQDNNYDH